MRWVLKCLRVLVVAHRTLVFHFYRPGCRGLPDAVKDLLRDLHGLLQYDRHAISLSVPPSLLLSVSGSSLSQISTRQLLFLLS